MESKNTEDCTTNLATLQQTWTPFTDHRGVAACLYIALDSYREADKLDDTTQDISVVWCSAGSPTALGGVCGGRLAGPGLCGGGGSRRSPYLNKEGSGTSSNYYTLVQQPSKTLLAAWPPLPLACAGRPFL